LKAIVESKKFGVGGSELRILFPGYEPQMKVSTKKLGEQIEITVRDNGMGIAESVKSKISSRSSPPSLPKQERD
jgi:signal transduction histidine kinase